MAKKVETLRKEAQDNIEKFTKEYQLLQQRMNLVAQEIIRLQGEVRGYDKQLKEEEKDEKKK
jgi:hypothetical protein